MALFDEDRVFDELALRRELPASLVDGLADAVARFYDGATITPEFGGRGTPLQGRQ